MKDIMKLARVELIIIPIFILLKYIRPSILESESPEFFKLILLSIPNFFEAIIGTLTLTGIGLIINDKLKVKHQLKSKFIYIIALVLTGIYVSTQELKIHNLGGNNVFDKNDLIFSFIGLIIGYWIIMRIKPIINNQTKTESPLE
ncbi:hypothetical protein [Patiriisocius hiemis]|uniref:VanZ-like domain-containing protein n=1 Tax=Patiriisocius hiemis TaxID=3075604 RepID=A0ABU2Y8F1_9FLAO|nr:hypothetical protein [Constantimarinum sp. W242]MDT0554468.1 hypothetical protein [Constantimarinum sp. W242]